MCLTFYVPDLSEEDRVSQSIGRRPLLAALPVASVVVAGGAAAEGDLRKVQKRTFTAKDFKLVSGTVMPEVTIAYETYGTLAPDGRNAVLLTHGYTSSQHMAGRYGENGAEGSWDGLVGPGKAIDTDRLFVVSSNMLGSRTRRIVRSEEHTSELQSHLNLVCRLLLEKKKHTAHCIA